jgi:hypothetical protein
MNESVLHGETAHSLSICKNMSRTEPGVYALQYARFYVTHHCVGVEEIE